MPTDQLSTAGEALMAAAIAYDLAEHNRATAKVEREPWLLDDDEIARLAS